MNCLEKPSHLDAAVFFSKEGRDHFDKMPHREKDRTQCKQILIV